MNYSVDHCDGCNHEGCVECVSGSSFEEEKMTKTVSEYISKVYIESSQYNELMNHLNDNDEIVTEIIPVFVAGKMTSRWNTCSYVYEY